MKKTKLIITYILIALFILYLFLNKELEIIINNSLDLFITKIFPSLFPMLIVAELLISLNVPYYLDKYCSKITKKLFNLSGSSIYVFIISLISGTPSNAVICKNLINKNYLTEENATSLLACTLFLNPLFLITMLTLTFNMKITILLIINNYICSIILAFILKKHNKHTDYKIKYIKEKFSTSLINAINKTMSILTMILGTIVFYNLLKLSINNDYINLIFNIIFEITNGLATLSYNNININILIILASATISFSGLCIHTQIKSIISDTKIKYNKFIYYRFIHLILSLIGGIIISIL